MCFTVFTLKCKCDNLTRKHYKERNLLSVVIGLTCSIPVLLMQIAVEQTGSATALYSDSALRLHGKGERKSMWLFPVSFLRLTHGLMFHLLHLKSAHVCIAEYLSFLSNEFLPFNKIAFDWTRPDGAEVVLLIGPDVSNEAEVLELTSSLYSQLMCKGLYVFMSLWYTVIIPHTDLHCPLLVLKLSVILLNHWDDSSR